MKLNASQFYNRLQSILDGGSESELSDDEDLNTPLLPQDRWVVFDTDDDNPTNGDYLIIPASDDEIDLKDEDDVPLSIRLSRLVSNKSKKPKEPKPI